MPTVLLLLRQTVVSARKHHHFAELLPGDLAAVTSNGDVYRIDSEKIGRATQYLAADLPGVVEARAAFEIDRERTAGLWDKQRMDNAAARAAFDKRQALRGKVAAMGRAVDRGVNTVEATAETGAKATGGLLRGVARGVEGLLGGILGFLAGPGPKLAPHQAELEARAAQERTEAHALAAGEQENRDAYDWARFDRSRQEQQEDLARSQMYGGPATREASLNPDANRRREQEQDRGYERD